MAEPTYPWGNRRTGLREWLFGPRKPKPEPPICADTGAPKDPRGCWNVRCQLGGTCCRASRSASPACDDHPFQSRFKLGERAYFQPNMRLIDARTGNTDPTVAAPCEIVGVGFGEVKVFYDLDVIYVEEYQGSRIENRHRITHVPSDMVAQAEDSND